MVANGKNFHQECFVCHVCDDKLDTELFYQFQDRFYCEKDKEVTSKNLWFVTKENKSLIQECLNKCQVCNDYIAEGSVRAEGSFFHPSCFKCDKCGIILLGEFFVGPKGEFICPQDYKVNEENSLLNHNFL